MHGDRGYPTSSASRRLQWRAVDGAEPAVVRRPSGHMLSHRHIRKDSTLTDGTLAHKEDRVSAARNTAHLGLITTSTRTPTTVRNAPIAHTRAHRAPPSIAPPRRPIRSVDPARAPRSPSTA